METRAARMPWQAAGAQAQKSRFPVISCIRDATKIVLKAAHTFDGNCIHIGKMGRFDVRGVFGTNHERSACALRVQFLMNSVALRWG